MMIDFYSKELERITDLANFYMQDVLDISFVSGHQLEVFIAADRKSIIKGLGNKDSIPVDGMLFFFEVSTYVPFTMKDMMFDLDIAWYDEKGKLIQHGSFKAGEVSPITCPKAFKYVLEVPAGTLPVSDLSLNG